MMNDNFDPDAPDSWMSVIKEHSSIQDICDAAEALVEQKRYDEAIALFVIAQRVYPESLALRLNLARVRDLKKRALDVELQKAHADWELRKADNDLLAHHFISLARVYMQRDQFLRALELLQLARYLNPNLATIHYLLGRIFYEQLNAERALQELGEARKLDIFNADIAHLQSRLLIDLNRDADALQAVIDAYLLSGGEQSRFRELYLEQIRRLADRLQLTQADIEKIFTERREAHNRQVDELLNRRNKLNFTEGITNFDVLLVQLPKVEQARQSMLDLAVMLKRNTPFNAMTDEQVIAIARRSELQRFPTETLIFAENSHLETLYVIIEGKVKAAKPTPFGTLTLAVMHEGDILGELDFIDRMGTSADVKTTMDSTVVSIARSGLLELMIEDKLLGIQLYWHFWKILAERIRKANNKAQKFFKKVLERPDAEDQRHFAKDMAGPEKAHVDIQQKIALLREKGLSSTELSLLATFSQEQKYRKDQAIFHEGEAGDQFYIILDGTVRISKFIPGVGEEALAILERGEFFGEMALVDGSPRSADAIAHSGDVTVLAISERVLNDILSRDPGSAFRFLRILCRMMSQRLREINLKIFQWYMMAGTLIQDELEDEG